MTIFHFERTLRLNYLWFCSLDWNLHRQKMAKSHMVIAFSSISNSEFSEATVLTSSIRSPFATFFLKDGLLLEFFLLFVRSIFSVPLWWKILCLLFFFFIIRFFILVKKEKTRPGNCVCKRQACRHCSRSLKTKREAWCFLMLLLWTSPNPWNKKKLKTEHSSCLLNRLHEI